MEKQDGLVVSAFKRRGLRRLALIGMLAAGLSGVSASALAYGDARPGFIVNIQPNASGLVFFNQSSAHTNKPACAASNDRWAINAATPGGQALLSVLLTAYAAGKAVTITGTGACAEWPDTEGVVYFLVQ